MSCSVFPKMKLSAHDAKLANASLPRSMAGCRPHDGCGLLTSPSIGFHPPYLVVRRSVSTSTHPRQQPHQSLYILDEPSVGPPQRLAENLRWPLLKRLRDLGNTVVGWNRRRSHPQCDYIIEIGPLWAAMAVEWSMRDPTKNFWKVRPSQRSTSLANNPIPSPAIGAQQPIKSALWAAGSTTSKTLMLTYPRTPWPWWWCVGFGKTTLVKHILYPALLKPKGEAIPAPTGQTRSTRGRPQMVNGIEDQSGSPSASLQDPTRSPMSKPTTASENCTATNPCPRYVALIPKHFSLQRRRRKMRNLQGRWQHHRRNAIPGRHHPGLRRVQGQRFKSEVLEVRYNELNINESSTSP